MLRPSSASLPLQLENSIERMLSSRGISALCQINHLVLMNLLGIFKIAAQRSSKGMLIS